MDEPFISEISRMYGKKFVVTRSRNGYYGIEMLDVNRYVPREDVVTELLTYEEAHALKQLLRGNKNG